MPTNDPRDIAMLQFRYCNQISLSGARKFLSVNGEDYEYVLDDEEVIEEIVLYCLEMIDAFIRNEGFRVSFYNLHSNG